ncbi:MAG: SPOR domain-containing protein [Methyloprofundus sp.]|nr:SPOR domain-containing protein [Methyloprofundus sp.]
MQHSFGRATAILLFILPLQCLQAESVSVPLTLDFHALQQLLQTQLFKGPLASTEILHDPNKCSEIVLSDPKVSELNRHLQIKARLSAKIAVKMMNQCMPLLSWEGYAQIISDPVIKADSPRVIALQVVASHLINLQNERLTSGILWDQARQHIHPYFNQYRIDITPSINDMQTALPLFLPKHTHTQLNALLSSLHLANMQVNKSGLHSDVVFEVENIALVEQSEKKLSAQEQLQWQQKWQTMDALLTQTIKQYAAATELRELRQTLFDILLDARYQLQEALRQGQGDDLVRHWFLKSWTQLIPVIKIISAEHPDQAPLALITLVTATDALQALDKLGPTLGLDISVDGLRRFARLINHSEQFNTLKYDETVDPELIRLFEFNQDDDPRSEFMLDFWPISSAHAAKNLPLDSWIPGEHDLNNYLLAVRKLLQETAINSGTKRSLTKLEQAVFNKLILTTAWQESCWRQYEIKHNKIVPLRSSTNDTGLMQINEKVWRGLVDIHKLRWNMAYNIKSGSHILLNYMTRYAIKQAEHKQHGGIDNLARATYSAYNGGPSQIARYRNSHTPKQWQKVDAAFFDKYSMVQQGRELAVAECLGGSEIKSVSMPVAKKTAQAKVVANAGTELLMHNEAWIKQQNPEYFTLQLGVFSSRQSAARFVKQQNIMGNYAIYPFKKNRQNHYAVIYGRYSTQERAEKESHDFKTSAWIRQFKSIPMK